MLNPGNKVVVNSFRYGSRTRNCQSTVLPEAGEFGPVRSFNDWQIYLRFMVDSSYNAFNTIDTIRETESLLDEAKHILNQQSA